MFFAHQSLEDDDEDNCPIILTPNVNSGTLGKIVDYMKIQKNNPPKSIKKSVTGSDFKKVNIYIYIYIYIY